MRAEPRDITSLQFAEVAELPPLSEIEHGSLFTLSLSLSTNDFTHGLHRFPAKFIPHVPGWAFDNFGVSTGIAVDPFMGSGTSLVEAALRGRSAIGIDIDPLARFIGQAKVTPVHEARIAALAAELERRWTEPAKHLHTPMPDLQRFDHWFTRENWAWLQSLHDSIVALPASTDEQRFLLVVFSSILRWVSNADDQSQKTYVSGTLPKTPPSVRHTFWRALDRALTGLEDLNRKRSPQSILQVPSVGDATDLQLPPGACDLAVTSPPYLDSMDYPYNLMLEYFWLGPHIGVPTRKDFNQLRRRALGAKNPETELAIPTELEGLIDLEQLPPYRRAAASSYFNLMRQHFREMFQVLEDGGHYVMVVGNSATLRGAVPLRNALIRLAENAGFGLKRVFGYRIRRHYMKFPRRGRGGIILVDWVLVLRRGSESTVDTELPSPWTGLAPGAVAH